jgi:outer membrane protein assembly factor BamB
VEIRLKEKRIRTRDAIKAGSDKELEAAADTAAAHSVDELKAITSLIRNDAARLNGEATERVDDSTYEVILTRPFEPESPAWTGTLRGRVQVFSTPTLHLITAGTKLLAFAPGNRKAWEATLGSPVPIHRSDIEPETSAQPWLEAGGKLFFADGAFLTAFDAKSGQVAWRLPSVGIRKLQMDGEGNLYVLSDNLHVETLTYAADASLRDSVPLTMRVGAADGKIRWQMEKYEDVWASGKDVYVLREGKNPGDLEHQVFAPGSAPEARVKIYKLSRGNGEPMWEWFQTRRPRAVEVQGKKVALLFGDELQIVTSICW